MSLNDTDIGQNVQRARYRRNMTQAELARAMELDRTAVSRIEAGSRSLAATELARLAEVLSVPVQDLLLPSPETRRSPNLTRMLMREGPVSADDEHQLAWFVDLIERASVVAPASSLPPLGSRLLSLPAAAAGEIGARITRRKLGSGTAAPIVDLSGVLYRRGVLLTTARLPSRSRLAGCSLTLPSGLTAILVNANHLASRQRFTVAHELAHLIFDTESLVSACNAGEIRRGPRSQAEARADAFAAAFLLPKRVLRPLTGPRLDLERLYAVEAEYGVSHAAAVHRLHELGLLPEDEARVLRKIGGRTPAPRTSPPFRLVGESLARLVADDGARRSGDEQGYETTEDSQVIP